MNKIIKAFLFLACLQINEAKADATQALFDKSLGFSQQFQEVKKNVDELKEKVKERLTEIQKKQLLELPRMDETIKSMEKQILGFSQQFQQVNKNVEQLKERLNEKLNEADKKQLSELKKIAETIKSMESQINDLRLKQQHLPLPQSSIVFSELMNDSEAARAPADQLAGSPLKGADMSSVNSVPL